MPFNGIGMPMLMDGIKITHAKWIASNYPMHIQWRNFFSMGLDFYH
jgi:hypothetical protein